MTYLDADPDVVEWSYEHVSIPYVSNARTRRVRNYWPDFYVIRTSGAQLVEVKQSRKLMNAVTRKKLAAAAEWCAARDIELVVVTEVELNRLGLL